MDVFLSVPDEIRIYKKRRFKLPDLMYFLSRAVSGGLLLTRLILSGEPSVSRTKCSKLTNSVHKLHLFKIAHEPSNVRYGFPNSQPL